MSHIDRLLEIMAKLREPEGGCPWDVEQTFATIAPYTIEEAYEVEDAIRRKDFEALCDELGDLLLQVVFHAQMAREAGHFTFDAVVGAVCDKLVRRHPHVFGDATVESAEAQTDAWEEQKAKERSRAGHTSAADGVALGLPALLRAGKLVRRAERAGYSLPTTEDASRQAITALNAISSGAPSSLGPLLWSVVLLAYRQGIDAEEVLRAATAQFESELRSWEANVG